MSYLSTSENVGFSGITQNISDASCATQYKMAVETVSGGCSEVNMFIHDSSGDEQSYMPHLSESFFHTKFKIDPNELYTFHDSDVIAGEITVSHTEDNIMFPDNIDIKTRVIDNSKEEDTLIPISNGDIKTEKKEIVTNGHYESISNSLPRNQMETKVHAKVQKAKTNVNSGSKLIDTHCTTIPSPKGQNNIGLSNNCLKSSSSASNSNINNDKTTLGNKSNSETFLDVFKREQGLNENSATVIKTEPIATVTSIKPPPPTPKKPPAVKSSQSKPRKGRGPTVHEALQRIPQQRRALPISNAPWHAPGEEMFQCGPLDDKKPNAFRQLDSSSSDDDNMPEFESGAGPMCVEESAAESRGARLALRRAAMRRQVARAATSLHLRRGHKEDRALATLIKKQISGKSPSCRLPPQTVNHLLAMRGMTSVLTVQERRRLRASGWSGGESYRSDITTCAEERCSKSPLPCGRYCLSHVTLAPEQRLYAACAAVFAGGERCKQPLLPLQDQTPLCAEHAWKRDNYELLNREGKPKAARKRAWAPARPPRGARARRPKRRKRPAPQRPAPQRPAPQRPAHAQSLSEINVCSNSSTYDSSEDTAMGGLSENEYMTNNSHELEVGQVPPDDILDPSVLSQIPDEEFTEFFNQAESGAPFGESSELAAALEAVLDERDIADVFAHAPLRNKMAPAVSMESSSTPS